MYTSKSLLDSMTITQLEFDCESICAWAKANGGHLPENMNLPVVRKIGMESCFGAVYELTTYPGLVLKLCFKADDGYPEFIRQVAVKRGSKWAPKIFAHGGDETREGFWCVMPAYEALDQKYHVSKYANDGLTMAPAELRAIIQAADGYVPNIMKVSRANEYVRTVCHDISPVLSEMYRHGASSDIHMGNVMRDPATGRFIIIDPIGHWFREDKKAYRDAHK